MNEMNLSAKIGSFVIIRDNYIERWGQRILGHEKITKNSLPTGYQCSLSMYILERMKLS